MRIFHRAGWAALGALLSAGCAMAAPPSYTAAQAGAGASLYTQQCAMCHGANLEGGAGPALAGSAFTSQGQTLGAVFNILATQMPVTQPGGLTHTQYEDLMAYILQKNGYPPGGAPLTYDQAMSSTASLTPPGT